MASTRQARLAVDIGGTFTDVALDAPKGRVTVKVLTTPAAPERGVMEAVTAALAKAGSRLGEISLIMHGTTLATNALIERKGAVTALITTEGFRDSLEIGYEHRFEQYDVFLEKPEPLVPRRLRYTVPERLSARGEVLRTLDERAVQELVPALERERVASVAIGLLHSYANPTHERRIRDLLIERIPGLRVSLSSEVSPELREYERLSTACANAYVQPLMAGYLDRLERALRDAGFSGELLLMTSGGGVIGLEAAQRFPVRLVESGPAGGAVLASRIAAECGLDQVLSFDMGGTTAKICLIDHHQPQTSRTFEVARAYRFLKGSGLPLRVPVIEMVEIGAGGGSIARVDALKRVGVGPDSAGAAPGPACYGQGGEAPTVTDADLALGRIDPAAFAGGSLPLDTSAAADAIDRAIGAPLTLTTQLAALAVSEMVDENMASAARVHAVERGKSLDGRTMVAFGGAAPLHAARVAAKLGIRRILVPTGAGVGSAIGMLSAPIAYEVARSFYQRVAQLEPDKVNAHLEAMRAEARAVVEKSAAGAPLLEARVAYMRYIGQGHEIAVPLEARTLNDADRQRLHELFEREYRDQFGRTIPDLETEVLSWALSISAPVAHPARMPALTTWTPAAPSGQRRVIDPESGASLGARVFRRDDLPPGARMDGVALIVEDETTTVVPPGFQATVSAAGYLILERTNPP
ncbi:MAG TPA: hydantoinase/oxoprolinase family protein [Burkholderiales bacterium]|nr:hydantoinase/oxoprolinase family protein [Burkholderiales bacterium]